LTRCGAPRARARALARASGAGAPTRARPARARVLSPPRDRTRLTARAAAARRAQRPSNWPVPYVVQAAVYLEDTSARQGALRVVRGFHRRLAEWSAGQPANRSAERPEGAAAEALAAEAAPLEGRAGSLVVWHSLLPHGPAPNTGDAPRVSAYVTMLPVDAAPFLGPSRSPDAPLGMSDAGTLACAPPRSTRHHPRARRTCPRRPTEGCLRDARAPGLADLPDLPMPDGYQQEHCEPSDGRDGDSSAAAAAPSQFGFGGAPSGLKRQSRERRAERWRHRLPMLDEDPKEDELSRRPPGEEDGAPAKLTPLGERLAGLVEWEANADERD
jgi:hypothetical protein